MSGSWQALRPLRSPQRLPVIHACAGERHAHADSAAVFGPADGQACAGRTASGVERVLLAAVLMLTLSVRVRKRCSPWAWPSNA